ncbi:MAG: hypothetical protein ACREGJ_03825 [Candidatus Saccharimonadales bacterium]
MSSDAKRTTDHTEIREWAEARGGRPAQVRGTAKESSIGILRIDFPEGPDGDWGNEDSLEEISWDSFFRKFEAESLAFLYQETTAEGHISRFCKFVER